MDVSQTVSVEHIHAREANVPRQARLMLPDVPIHIIQRGNNRQDCFFGEDDYLHYLQWLGLYSRHNECRIHAYVLMTNHIHLLTSAATVTSAAEMMKALGQRYVQYVNRTRRRTGTLWDGRYRSCLTQTDTYFFACHRYIEMNPVRAKMVGHPAEYRWSSYRANAQGEDNTILQPHAAYDALDANQRARQTAYRELFQLDLEPKLVEEIRRATNGNLALGDQCFASDIEHALGRRAIAGRPGRPRK